MAARVRNQGTLKSRPTELDGPLGLRDAYWGAISWYLLPDRLKPTRWPALPHGSLYPTLRYSLPSVCIQIKLTVSARPKPPCWFNWPMVRVAPVALTTELSNTTLPSVAGASSSRITASVSPSLSPGRRLICACTPGNSDSNKVARSRDCRLTTCPLGCAVSTKSTANAGGMRGCGPGSITARAKRPSRTVT